MAMPVNTPISVIEATPKVVKALEKLTVNQPFGNETSSTKNKGMNGSVEFPVNGGDYVQGAFDVALVYIDEEQSDGQGGTTVVSVPKVKIYNSANINSQYAGYVYSGTSAWQLPVTLLTPMVGIVYVDVNYELNTRTIEIATSLPSVQTTDRRWVYALAEVTQPETNLFHVSRMNQPGNLQVFGRWVA